MSAKVKCDECGDELLTEDFCACHKCYFKLSREKKELERKIERLSFPGGTRINQETPAGRAEAPPDVPTGAGCIHY